MYVCLRLTKSLFRLGSVAVNFRSNTNCNLIPSPFSVACACRDKAEAICWWIEDRWFDFVSLFHRGRKLDTARLREWLAAYRDIWLICSGCETFTPLDRSVLEGMCEKLGAPIEVSMGCPHCGSRNASLMAPSSELAQKLLSGAKDRRKIAWEEWFASE